MKRTAKLAFLRAIAISLALASNFFFIRHSSVSEIGHYYILATISYFGNALFFVPFDLNLQRRIAANKKIETASISGIAEYFLKTVPHGAIGITLLYFAYCVGVKVDFNWQELLLCLSLSISMYCSLLGRDLPQLFSHPLITNAGQIIEGLLKLGGALALAFHQRLDAAGMISASAIGCAVAGSTSIYLLKLKVGSGEYEKYLESWRNLLARTAPIGISGITNWLQLQGYRLILAATPTGIIAVGTASFMTTLGSIGANAFLSVLSQIYVPKQYSEGIKATKKYINTITLSMLFLATLSIPIGLLFLAASNKSELAPFVYFVAIGVFIEAGNSIIGACINHANQMDGKYWYISTAGAVGTAITLISLLESNLFPDLYICIAFSLIAGQLITAGLSLFTTVYSNVK